uniref:Uncharacterized protein n=1 Tax=Oryza sativa subsp. japonica TaxID=39947 RepID=Q6ZDA9_ORYSJ|nr:hypothetical protein [Oryza sativa Japonica Group]BAC99492.1 hypothetical protein [Oryza sativa Japonica Group]
MVDSGSGAAPASHPEAQAAVRCRRRGGRTGTQCYRRPPARSRARTPHRLGVCCWSHRPATAVSRNHRRRGWIGIDL